MDKLLLSSITLKKLKLIFGVKKHMRESNLNDWQTHAAILATSHKYTIYDQIRT